MASSLTLGRPPARRRRLRALVVVLAALTGMLSLTAISGRARAADPPAASGTTVDGPVPGASVTVAQTKDLVNQVVQVTWKGFKPSTSTFLTDSTLNPVRVYQCKANPTSPKDCYGNTGQGLAEGTDDALGGIPEGPSNSQDALTAPDGTGSALVEVRTKLESPLLGCSSASPCALVVVPNWGDPKDPTTTANIHQIDFDFAWAKRVVVPITFAASSELCGTGDADFQLIGSPMSSRVIQSWQPGGCNLTGSQRFNVDYTALGEPDARAGFAAGTSDAVLTSEPLDGASAHPFTYAPLSASGIVVAFHVDDAQTGQPINDMKVNARLIAAYTLAAAYAGAAGALVAQTTAFVSLDAFEFQRSADVLLVLIIGGAGWLYGGIAGAVIFKLLQDAIAAFTPQYWQFWLGLVLVVIVLIGRERMARWVSPLRVLGDVVGDRVARVLGAPPR